MTTTQTTATYRVLGTTDAVTECGVCGKTDLRGTTVLDTGSGTIYAGSDCAAKLAGRPVREIERDARRADREAAQEARRAADEARRAVADDETRALMLWVDETYGVPVRNCTQVGDLWGKVDGMSPFQLRMAWREAAAAS